MCVNVLNRRFASSIPFLSIYLQAQSLCFLPSSSSLNAFTISSTSPWTPSYLKTFQHGRNVDRMSNLSSLSSGPSSRAISIMPFTNQPNAPSSTDIHSSTKSTSANLSEPPSNVAHNSTTQQDQPSQTTSQPITASLGHNDNPLTEDNLAEPNQQQEFNGNTDQQLLGVGAWAPHETTEEAT